MADKFYSNQTGCTIAREVMDSAHSAGAHEYAQVAGRVLQWLLAHCEAMPEQHPNWNMVLEAFEEVCGC